MKRKSYISIQEEQTFDVDEIIKILREKKLIRGRFIEMLFDKCNQQLLVDTMIQREIKEE